MNRDAQIQRQGSVDPASLTDQWLRDYAALAGSDDVMLAALGRGDTRWPQLLRELAALAGGEPAQLQQTVNRQAADIGMAFRLQDEKDERVWPLGALPLLVEPADWRHIEASMIQRAQLLEAIVGDIYGKQSLIAEGALPATAIAGSPDFWRQMVGVTPAGTPCLQFLAVDIGRGPDGEWRVLADHCRTPAGAGYALENRIALSRATGELHARLDVRRLAPFFADFRNGLAARCERSSPRIALLTPGRYNQSYAEQAHLARYLGLLLVEGADLTVHDEKLYVRTIEGPKRIDALWRRLDARYLDPLAFDVGSRIGTPALFDALVAGQVVVANAPGVGVVESPAISAFLPRLARLLLGADLMMPNTATWWCGQQLEREHVLNAIGRMVIEPAFIGRAPIGLPRGQSLLGSDLSGRERDELLADIAARPGDYVGREVVHLSTMPAFEGNSLRPRPFMLRVFLARDGQGNWTVMPGGFVRQSDGGDVRAAVMGEGTSSADLWLFAEGPVTQLSLLDPPQATRIRRKSGVLPSRAADALYWLGRYIERGEMTTRVIRSSLTGTISGDVGADRHRAKELLGNLLVSWGAVPQFAAGERPDLTPLCVAALNDAQQPGSVAAQLRIVRSIAMGVRERLSPDFWRLANAPYQRIGDRRTEVPIERASRLLDRFSALSGMANENMTRGPGWQFHDLGRRIERAASLCRLVRLFAEDTATPDQLSVLLDLYDNQITYRARYLGGLAVDPVRDLLALDPQNPRSLAFQVQSIRAHLLALPTLRDDGMPEWPVRIAEEIAARVGTLEASMLGEQVLLGLESQMVQLSDAISQRFFLQGSDLDYARPATQLA